MSTFSKTFKLSALGALVAGGIAIADTSPASAYTMQTRCDAFGDNCVEVRCTDIGNYCTDVSYYDAYDRYGRPARYACDRDGDYCRWTRNYHYNAYGDAVLND